MKNKTHDEPLWAFPLTATPDALPELSMRAPATARRGRRTTRTVATPAREPGVAAAKTWPVLAAGPRSHPLSWLARGSRSAR